MNLEQLFETCSFGEFTENTIEIQESLYTYHDANMKMRTRMMFFDLIDICD